MKCATLAMAVLAASLAANPGLAACSDDVKTFKARLAAHPKQGDQKTIGKELAKAQDLSTSDESGCLNALARARKAFAVQPEADAKAEKSVQPVQPLYQK